MKRGDPVPSFQAFIKRSQEVPCFRRAEQGRFDRFTFLDSYLRPCLLNSSRPFYQVSVGIDEGLKHESAIHCDELVSLPKSALTDFVGSLPLDKLAAVNEALKIALELTGTSADV